MSRDNHQHSHVTPEVIQFNDESPDRKNKSECFSRGPDVLIVFLSPPISVYILHKYVMFLFWAAFHGQALLIWMKKRSQLAAIAEVWKQELEASALQITPCLRLIGKNITGKK